MKGWNEFVNEKFHVNQDVKHLTKIIYDKINLLIPNLILKKEIEIKNLLQDNYTGIKFKNDIIRLKIGTNHGAINKPFYNNGVVEDLILELTIKLNQNELISKKLINNRIRETINHEVQHVFEFYNTKVLLTDSWIFDSRLKQHQEKFKNCNKWINICHMFYLMEEHELRSRISQSLEFLKNNKDSSNIETIFHNYIIFTELNNISKLSENTILKIMYQTYLNFDEILNDFVKNVLLKNNSNNNEEIFLKEINKIKNKATESKNKLNRVLYFYKNPNLFLEEYIERNIDFTPYI
jgi:hypothetical protein